MDWDGVWYTCHFKGNTLVKIEPETLSQLWQRLQVE
jgi:hypothetical protein